MGPCGWYRLTAHLCSACKSKENHFERFTFSHLLLKKEAIIFFVQELLNQRMSTNKCGGSAYRCVEADPAICAIIQFASYAGGVFNTLGCQILNSRFLLFFS